MRNLYIAALCFILCKLWNDHISFVYNDLIADSLLQFFHHTNVVETGSADSRSF